MVALVRGGRCLWPDMLRSTVTVTLTATLLTLTVVGRASAANPCSSEYMKFREFFEKNGAKIMKGICDLTSKQDAEKAKKCLGVYEDGLKKVNDLIAKHNSSNDDNSLTIGPRPLGEGVWKTGKLQGQRTWVSPPVMSDTFRVQMERTGGKASSNVSGTVCFLDADGALAQPAVEFTINPGQPTFDRTFAGVSGLKPVVLLSMPFDLFKAHQYKIMGERGGEPQLVQEARQLAQGGAQGGGGGVSLRFNNAGPIPGMTCAQTLETADLAGTWQDNYFCASQDIGMRWSSSGPLPGMRCTQVNEPSEPATTGWGDNFVCVPPGAPVTLQWSYAGPIGGKTCVAWNEGADPHTWNDNYMCY